jgi:hypothetical protein
MTTLTESPDQRLELSIDEVDKANRRIKRLNQAVQEAKTRASDAQNFVAAAALEYQNADARFLVLTELREKQGKLADAQRELLQAQEMENSVNRTLAALRKATAAAERLVASAETAVTGLDGLQKDLAADAEAAPNGHKAPLTNAARKVGGLRTNLARQRDKLKEELATATADYEAIPEITGVAELQKDVADREADLHSDRPESAKRPAASSADLEKATADRDNAQLVKDQAAQADQDAQADLRAKQAELADAQTAYAEAVAMFEQVEEQFIDRIVVSEPDATGWATARAVLKPDMTIPAGYKLRWQAGGADMEELDSQALAVRIDANALPVGNTAVEATIEREPEL